jgi:dTDP-4-dehydrorhamnose reductase
VRILVTGAGGGLGRAVLAVAPSHHDLVPLARAELDVGDHHAVMRTVPALRPDLVLSLAAFTDVDGCERDPARAARDNALGPQSLALAARACDATLLHVSTDFVFDGRKASPYDELDPPNPLSVYGRTKLGGEGFVRSIVPESFVVRTSYVFGNGRDYVSGAVRRLAAGEEAGGIDDRLGSPTFVRHLAERLIPLALTGRFGTYHLAGPEPGSWFHVLERARTVGGLPGRLARQRSEDLRLPAPRPSNSSLTSSFAAEIGVPPFPSFDEAVKELLGAV